MKFYPWNKGITTFMFPVSFFMIFLTGLLCAAEGPDSMAIKPQFYDQNEKCFRCHGSSKYTYMNNTTGKEITSMMCDSRVFRRDAFYTGNHRSFACIDCHSADYDSFPHPGALRMEEKYNCIDCHGNDEKFAKFKFEEIENEFHKSVHYVANSDAFTCWKCHNPHSYKINVRDTKDVTKSIAYDNHICLNCHSNFDRFQLLTEKKEINLILEHEWLPNQALHFSQVRCIECHARPNDSLLVAHQIMPKTSAVKRCVECHSQNSLLMGSLYKFRAKENRTNIGFLNAIILNNAFVIGANRNVILNKVSVAVFLLGIALALAHLTLRVAIKRRLKDE